MTPAEELGKWLLQGGIVAGATASTVIGIVWLWKSIKSVLVTRAEFDQLKSAVEELKLHAGKLNPEAEEQQLKMTRKLLAYVEHLEEKQNRDAERRK